LDIHTLVTCGAFTPEGEFLEVHELDMDRLETAWREAVFALYLDQQKITPEVVENMRGWTHSGFSVDQSVYLPAGDRPGVERLVQYMTRCPFSLSRLVKVSGTGQVIYKAEKDACRRFPDPRGDGMTAGPKRNFQVLEPLEFLAEFTQHIPPKGSHLIRYYGWYSNKARGIRRKAAIRAATRAGGLPPPVIASRCSQTWAMLIKRVYEVDPMACPKCGGQMKVVAFIEPPQGAVIERILRYCGLWNPSVPRAPPAVDDWGPSPWSAVDGFADTEAASSGEPREWTYVDIDTFEAAF